CAAFFVLASVSFSCPLPLVALVGGQALLFFLFLQFFQGFAASGFCGVYFHLRLRDVIFLLFKVGTPVAQDLEHFQQLLFVAGEGFIPKVEQLLGLGQGKPHALAAQDQLQAYPVFVAEDTGLPAPGGVQKPLVFVEADASSGYVELLGELADIEGFLVAHVRSGTVVLFLLRVIQVYVNVKHGLWLAWAPSLPVVRAGTRGVGYFSSGKNNSLRSDIFFPVRKIPHTPLPTGSAGIPRKKQREHPEIGVNVALVPIRHKNTAAVISRLPANARRRGVAVGFFAGKRCLSEASCFSKKNPTATPQARPHNRKARSPKPSRPTKREVREPKPDSQKAKLKSAPQPRQSLHHRQCRGTPHRVSGRAASVH